MQALRKGVRPSAVRLGTAGTVPLALPPGTSSLAHRFAPFFSLAYPRAALCR